MFFSVDYTIPHLPVSHKILYIVIDSHQVNKYKYMSIGCINCQAA